MRERRTAPPLALFLTVVSWSSINGRSQFKTQSAWLSTARARAAIPPAKPPSSSAATPATTAASTVAPKVSSDPIPPVDAADPDWASINLGALLCLECSGIHRAMGVHVSRVRSLTLDVWEPTLLSVMAELGNATVNATFAARVRPEAAVRDTDARDVKERFIRAKYAHKEFVAQEMSQESATTV